MAERPSSGDRYLVAKPFDAKMRLYWRTGQMEDRAVVVPPTLEFTVTSAPTAMSRDVVLTPKDPTRWEGSLLEDGENRDRMYGGYALVVLMADLQENCTKL